MPLPRHPSLPSWAKKSASRGDLAGDRTLAPLPRRTAQRRLETAGAWGPSVSPCRPGPFRGWLRAPAAASKDKAPASSCAVHDLWKATVWSPREQPGGGTGATGTTAGTERKALLGCKVIFVSFTYPGHTRKARRLELRETSRPGAMHAHQQFFQTAQDGTARSVAMEPLAPAERSPAPVASTRAGGCKSNRGEGRGPCLSGRNDKLAREWSTVRGVHSPNTPHGLRWRPGELALVAGGGVEAVRRDSRSGRKGWIALTYA